MISQSQYVLEKFRANSGRLTTGDFIKDIHTAAEYRRIICDLKKKGYIVISSKIKSNLWEYHLIDVDNTGQLLMMGEGSNASEG